MLKECPWKTKRFRQTSIVFGLSQGSCRENFHYSRHNFGWSRSDKIMNQQRKKLMTIVSNIRYLARQSLPMCEIYPYSEFFWSVFFPHLDWIGRYTVYLSAFRPNGESTDQKNYKYGHFSCTILFWGNWKTDERPGSNSNLH